MGGEAIRKCTSLAPASRIMRTILTEVVPRTSESSISTMRLPAITARLALCFMRTPSSRIDWVGWMKVRPDIVIADDAEFVGDAGGLRVADRGGYAGIRHRHHDIGGDGGFGGEFAADVLADLVDAAAADDGVGAGEIDVFENAGPGGLRRKRPERAHAVLVVDDDLAVLDFADIARADDVEGAGFRGEDRTAVEFADHQRADAERIARADQLFVGERDEGVGAFELAQRVR